MRFKCVTRPAEHRVGAFLLRRPQAFVYAEISFRHITDCKHHSIRYFCYHYALALCSDTSKSDNTCFACLLITRCRFPWSTFAAHVAWISVLAISVKRRRYFVSDASYVTQKERVYCTNKKFHSEQKDINLVLTFFPPPQLELHDPQELQSPHVVMHGPTLQSISLRPEPRHPGPPACPPWQVRVSTCLPGPHEALQDPNAVHCPHFPGQSSFLQFLVWVSLPGQPGPPAVPPIHFLSRLLWPRPHVLEQSLHLLHSDHRPGQGCFWHASDCVVCRPLASGWHSMLVGHDLLLLLSPPPHVWEHLVQALHCVKPI